MNDGRFEKVYIFLLKLRDCSFHFFFEVTNYSSFIGYLDDIGHSKIFTVFTCLFIIILVVFLG